MNLTSDSIHSKMKTKSNKVILQNRRQIIYIVQFPACTTELLVVSRHCVYCNRSEPILHCWNYGIIDEITRGENYTFTGIAYLKKPNLTYH